MQIQNVQRMRFNCINHLLPGTVLSAGETVVNKRPGSSHLENDLLAKKMFIKKVINLNNDRSLKWGPTRC